MPGPSAFPRRTQPRGLPPAARKGEPNRPRPAPVKSEPNGGRDDRELEPNGCRSNTNPTRRGADPLPDGPDDPDGTAPASIPGPPGSRDGRARRALVQHEPNFRGAGRRILGGTQGPKSDRTRRASTTPPPIGLEHIQVRGHRLNTLSGRSWRFLSGAEARRSVSRAIGHPLRTPATQSLPGKAGQNALRTPQKGGVERSFRRKTGS